MILGLDLAVGSMKKKEQSEFVFTPEMAYGINGCPPRIPGNAYVYFKVDLLDWVDSCAAEAFSKLPAKTRKELPFAQVLEAAKSEKRKGNAQFAKNNYTAVSLQSLIYQRLRILEFHLSRPKDLIDMHWAGSQGTGMPTKRMKSSGKLYVWSFI